MTSQLIYTCYRIGDIDRSVEFYTALGYEVSIVTKSLGRSDAYFPPLHRITASFKDGVLIFETMNKKTFSSEM